MRWNVLYIKWMVEISIFWYILWAIFKKSTWSSLGPRTFCQIHRITLYVWTFSVVLSSPSDLSAMTLVSTARDEVLNDLIVSGSNKRSKLKYLQKCGSQERKKNVKLQDEMSYNTWKIQQEQKATWLNVFSNFSCMFLHPNIFFHLEF